MTIIEKLARIELGDIIRFSHNHNGRTIDYIVYVTENNKCFGSITGRYTMADDYQGYENLLKRPYGGFVYAICIAVEILFTNDFDLGI